MAVEEADEAQHHSAHYGRTTARKGSIPLGLIVPGTVLLGVILFFGLGFSFSFTHGDSMEPNYHSGSLVIERTVEPESLKVGDVISFYAPWADAYVMHRIASIRSGGGELWFRTKGDNNPVRDPEEVTFQDRKPQKLVAAFPGGVEAVILLIGGILGLVAIKVISDQIIQSD